jgi:phosphoribosylformimino-5-aminoimidazole carboxamide ribotide isomerase
MFVIPTVYLRGGTIANPTEAGASPLPHEVRPLAENFRHAGVEMVHLVDLEAPAAAGHSPNETVIRTFTEEFGFHCQLQAKTKSVDMIAHYFQLGIARCILGTLAYQHPEFAETAAGRFPGKIGVEIHVRHGKVAIPGWTVATRKTAIDYLDRFRDQGVALVLYSDVDIDGELSPDNFARIRTFAEQAQMPVIHNADITTTDQMDHLLQLEKFGVMGSVFGRSLFEGRLDLFALISMVKDHEQTIEQEDATLIPDEE